MILAWGLGLLVAFAQGEGSGAGPWLTVSRDRGAESCPDAQSLTAAVQTELGLPRPDLPRVHCALSRAGRTWRGLVRIEGEGERPATVRTIRSRGADCRELASALELTLTLALARPTADGPAMATPVPIAVQALDPETPPGLAAAPPASSPWALSAGVVLSAGGLLDVAAGLEGAARWRRGRLVLALEGRAERAFARNERQVALAGWGATGALVPCFARGPGALCGVVRAGLLRASAGARSGWGAVAETGARAAWRFGGDARALALYMEATTPLVRTRLLVDGRARWASPAAALSLGLGAQTE